MDTPKNQDSIFPLGSKAPAEYFTGNAYVKMLIEKPKMKITTKS